jgi:hypothetical protein
VINANQAGNADYNAAAQVQLSFDYISVTSTEALYVCKDAAQCNTIETAVFGGVIAAETNLSSTVQVFSDRYVNCSSVPWISTCNVEKIAAIYQLNADRVQNFVMLLDNATAFNQSCFTQDCRDSMIDLISTYLPLAEAASTSCTSAACKRFASGQADEFRDQVALGVPGSLSLEKLRFDTYLSSVLQQKLEEDTVALILCNDEPGCVNAAYANLNASYANFGYVVEAIRKGMRILAPSNPSSRMVSDNPVVAELDANFTACALGYCEIPLTNSIFRGKRGVYKYLGFWLDRLKELRAACNTTNCTAEVSAEQQRSSTDFYLMSDYVPLQIVLPGILFYSLLFCACVAIAVLGFLWKVRFLGLNCFFFRFSL